MIHPSTLKSTIADEDGAVVLDMERGVIMTMNATGGFVWKRLGEQVPRERIARELAAATGMNVEQVEQDVSAFAEDLRAAGLLKPQAQNKPWENGTP